MWLPHGLAAGVTPATLKPLINICKLPSTPPPAGATRAREACASLGFNLTRPALGQLRMAAPNLEPRERYRVDVQAAPGVKDAFGLPLQVGSRVGRGMRRCWHQGRQGCALCNAGLPGQRAFAGR